MVGLPRIPWESVSPAPNRCRVHGHSANRRRPRADENLRRDRDPSEASDEAVRVGVAADVVVLASRGFRRHDKGRRRFLDRLPRQSRIFRPQSLRKCPPPMDESESEPLCQFRTILQREEKATVSPS